MAKDDLGAPSLGAAPQQYDPRFFDRALRQIELTLRSMLSVGSIRLTDIINPSDSVLTVTSTGFTLTDNGVDRIQVDSNGMTAIKYCLATTAPVTKTANFSVAANENNLINNKAGSTCTVTLPTPSTYTGRILLIKTIQAQTTVSASSNVVPLAGGAAGTAILAATAGRWAILVSNGTNWEIMAAN